MATANRSFNDSEWTWQDGGQHFAVRWFPQQDGLIWSVWIETANGPAFGDGIRQRTEDFLQRGAPSGHPAPDHIMADMRRALTEPRQATQTGGLLARLRRRIRGG